MIPTPLTGLARAVRGDVRFGEPLSEHTSFGVGGPADAIVFPVDVDDAVSCFDYATRMHIPVLIMGGGTNFLVGDLGIRGIVLKIGDGMDKLSLDGEEMFCGGGRSLASIVAESVKKNLSGLEYCFGIPGTVGGAVAMNAGSSAIYISRCVDEVGYIMQSGERVMLSHEQMHFDYRSSVALRSGGIIEHVRFRLRPANPEQLQGSINKIRDYRQKTQPWGYPNAGCVFRNPPASFAGKLIEDAGLKGMRIGGIEVSTIHANFLINIGGGSSLDVAILMQEIIDKIYYRYNVRLQPEVRIVGEWSKHLSILG